MPGQPGKAAPLFQPPPPPPAPPAPPGQRGRGQGAGRGQGPQGPYSMCYAISASDDPMGSYYRYEFLRPLFPDYPRPAIWRDGYYVPTSTSDEFIQKHACVVDREKMLKGEPATEQCLVLDGVGFLNNADVDGKAMPPPGAPNVIMTRRRHPAEERSRRRRCLRLEDLRRLEARGKYQGDWPGEDCRRAVSLSVRRPAQELRAAARHRPPARLAGRQDHVASRLSAIGNRESIVGVHSINTTAGGGGVRWYEFRRQGPRRWRSISRARSRRMASFAGWRARPSTVSATSGSAIRSAGRHISPASASPAAWPTIP